MNNLKMIKKLEILWVEIIYYFNKLNYKIKGYNLKQFNKRIKKINKNLIAVEQNKRLEILYKKIMIVYYDKAEKYILNRKIIELIKKELGTI